METKISNYPLSVELGLDLSEELRPWFQALGDGISEFCFSNLYLFRNTYKYRITRLGSDNFGLSGTKDGLDFFVFPSKLPSEEVLWEILSNHDYVKGLSRRLVEEEGDRFRAQGWEIHPDRDNFDYLYNCREMAELHGKKFHKKRNQIHGFFQNHKAESRWLMDEDTPIALDILERWKEERDDLADYEATREALLHRKTLGLVGKIFFADGIPAAFTLGEALEGGRSFVIHFEKGLTQYRGIYQMIYQDFSCELVDKYELINREQDLGNPGLRQAKMTYRPIGFVEKYRAYPPGLFAMQDDQEPILDQATDL